MVAFAVTSRQREIGLRMALGATAIGVTRWVLRQSVGSQPRRATRIDPAVVLREP